MSSLYPGALDTLTVPSGTLKFNATVPTHQGLHQQEADAIQAIQATLGINPQGGSGTVAARLAAIESGYQPADADLTAIAALATTTFGRALLTLADAVALRTAAGLAAIAASGDGADLVAPVPIEKVTNPLKITHNGTYDVPQAFVLAGPYVYLTGTAGTATIKSDGLSLGGFSSDLGNATSFSFDNVVSCPVLFSPSGGSTTTLSFPLLVSANQLILSSLNSLTSVSLPALKYIGNGIALPATVTTISLPALEYSKFANPVGGSALTSISMPALKVCHTIQTSMTTLTSLTLTALTKIQNVTAGTQGINISAATGLTTLSFPGLQTINTLSNNIGITGATLAALTTLSLPSLVSISSGTGASLSFTSGTAALANVTLGTSSTLKSISGNVIFSSCALTQASVDHILAQLVLLDGTNGTTLYTGAKTVTLTGTSSAPSATGLTNKATLQARGITVNTN